MAPFVVLPLEDDVACSACPRPRDRAEFFGEMTKPQLHATPNILCQPLPCDLPAAGLLEPVVRALVVDARGRGGAGGAEPVDAHPGADLVVGPGIAVGPVVQLLVDPRQQRGGRVCEGVADCLRLRRLLVAVAGAFVQEPGQAGEGVFLTLGVWREGVLQGEARVLGPGRARAVVHVDVCGAASAGVENGHCARDEHAPVAALGDVLGVAQGEHELVARLGVLLKGEAFARRAAAEAVVGEGERDDVEGGRPVREGFDDLGGFEEGARPAMDEEEGDCGRVGAAGVQEVDGQGLEAGTLDGGGEVWELV